MIEIKIQIHDHSSLVFVFFLSTATVIIESALLQNTSPPGIK